MEFIKAMKVYDRMCDNYKLCKSCPMTNISDDCDDCHVAIHLFPEETEAILQKWADEHPIKTRKMDLLEKYPNAKMRDDVPCVCAEHLGYCDKCPAINDVLLCDDCWDTEMEE